MTRISSSNLKKIAGCHTFYTYMHARKSDGKVFYVGKGKLNRAWSRDGRSERWKRVDAKHGFTVEICSSWPSEAEAFGHERLLISAMRDIGQPIVNSTDGGDGVSGYRRSPEMSAKLSEALKKFRGTEKGVAATMRSRASLLKRIAEDDGYVARMTRGLRAYQSLPRNKQSVAENMKRAQLIGWSGEDRNKRIERMLASEASTGAAARRARRTLQDPGNRSRIDAGRDAFFAVQENRDAVGSRMSAYYTDPENLERHRQAAIERNKSAAYRAAASIARGGRPFTHMETGNVYATQGDACAALGIRQPLLSAVLNGSRKSTGGNTFKYIDGVEK